MKPAWLYVLFALAMLAVAAYAAMLLARSTSHGRPSGRDVDIAHLFMGVAMAGMFVPSWYFGPRWLWQLIFGALLVWFVVRSVESLRRFGLHIPHETIHAAMSLAMVLMYWYPISTGGHRSVPMSMTPGGAHSALDPGFGLVLVLVFCGSAVFTLASPVKGASHHGRHLPPSRAALAHSGGPQDEGPSGDRTVGVEPAAARPNLATEMTAPAIEDLAHVVMSLGMAFMLVLML